MIDNLIFPYCNENIDLQHFVIFCRKQINVGTSGIAWGHLHITR